MFVARLQITPKSTAQWRTNSDNPSPTLRLAVPREIKSRLILKRNTSNFLAFRTVLARPTWIRRHRLSAITRSADLDGRRSRFGGRTSDGRAYSSAAGRRVTDHRGRRRGDSPAAWFFLRQAGACSWIRKFSGSQHRSSCEFNWRSCMTASFISLLTPQLSARQTIANDRPFTLSR